MRDAVNKASRIVINRCLAQGIGTVVFGWNVGQKQASGMGKKANQNLYTPQGLQRIRDKAFMLCRDSIT
jgi:hypothetical protein